MTVRTFIGTTEESLKKCRESAIKAAQIWDFEPITTESWFSDSQDIVCICYKKIQEKFKQEISLYIGIFGYCYDCVPLGLEESIIEVEFNAAAKCKIPMLAFIPTPMTPFNNNLLKCAAKHTLKKARCFFERVSKVTDVSLFNDENDFAIKVTQRIKIRSEKGLRSIASHENSPLRNENKVFISYIEEDWDQAKKIYDDLKQLSIQAWIDKEDLLPGEKWKTVIHQAIRNSFYFLLLLSSKSISKKGQAQKQIKTALDFFDEFPKSKNFIIPVRLEDCEVPIELQHLWPADLFSSYEDGLEKILRVLKKDNCNEGM